MSVENDNINLETISRFDTGSGFEIPDQYFESLHQHILNKTAANGFTTPAGYFEQLEQRLLKKVHAPRAPFALLQGGSKWAVLAAASLIAVSAMFLFLNQSAPAYAVKINELTDEEIVNYIEAADIHEEALLEVAFKTDDKHTDQTVEYLLNSTETDLILEEL